MIDLEFLNFLHKKKGNVEFFSPDKEDTLDAILGRFVSRKVNFGIAIINQLDLFETGYLSYDKELNRIYIDTDLKKIQVNMDDYEGCLCTLFISIPLDSPNKVETPNYTVEELSKTLDQLKSGLSSFKKRG